MVAVGTVEDRVQEHRSTAFCLAAYPQARPRESSTSGATQIAITPATNAFGNRASEEKRDSVKERSFFGERRKEGHGICYCRLWYIIVARRPFAIRFAIQVHPSIAHVESCVERGFARNLRSSCARRDRAFPGGQGGASSRPLARKPWTHSGIQAAAGLSSRRAPKP